MEYILPIKLDNTDIPGLLPTIGYVDDRVKTVEEIADMMILKLHNKH